MVASESQSPLSFRDRGYRRHLSVEGVSRSHHRITGEMGDIVADIFGKYNLPHTACGRARIRIQIRIRIRYI